MAIWIPYIVSTKALTDISRYPCVCQLNECIVVLLLETYKNYKHILSYQLIHIWAENIILHNDTKSFHENAYTLGLRNSGNVFVFFCTVIIYLGNGIFNNCYSHTITDVMEDHSFIFDSAKMTLKCIIISMIYCCAIISDKQQKIFGVLKRVHCIDYICLLALPFISIM